MIKQSLRDKAVLARKWALFFAVLGLVPIDFFIPPLAVFWDHKLFITLALAIYFAIYVLSLTTSLRILWICDRRALQSLKIKIFKTIELGRYLVNAIEWARMLAYKKNWKLSWKIIYYLFLIVLGWTPLVIKFGIGLCVLRNNKLSLVCLIIGTLIRSYCLVYLGADFIKWLFDN